MGSLYSRLCFSGSGTVEELGVYDVGWMIIQGSECLSRHLRIWQPGAARMARRSWPTAPELHGRLVGEVIDMTKPRQLPGLSAFHSLKATPWHILVLYNLAQPETPLFINGVIYSLYVPQ